ncbi:AbiTii domain-containing protein [Bradyrhizobium sp. CCBAU 11361]|uniref:AbiTii domain-containing protein n=1 Tax=Bradyrhizobium sp. CCBAU 11361 TaxID=1630812 RepID=UPI003FA48B95
MASVGDSVARLESLLSKTSGEFIKQYSADILKSLSKHNGTQLTQGGCSIPHSAFAGILDAVRNLVLDWAIELERAGRFIPSSTWIPSIQ